MFHLHADPPSVSIDGATGRPRRIRMDGDRLEVTRVESVRDETAAYPVSTGPRTVFVVWAAGRRFRLVHTLRDRRWQVQDLATREPETAHAA